MPDPVIQVTSEDQETCLNTSKDDDFVLVDAIQTLLDQLPRPNQLLLSAHPIKEPWPLATYGNKEDGTGPTKNAKRRRNDDVEGFMLDLDDVLKHRIPLVLQRLQGSIDANKFDWLSLEDYDRVVVNAGHEKASISWPALVSQGGTKMDALLIAEDNKVKAEGKDIAHRLVVNTSNTMSILEAAVEASDSTTHILLPQRSGFLLSDILRSQLTLPQGWTQILDFAQMHPPDLVLLDPPYPNQSAKRLKDGVQTYKPIDDLYDLWNMVTPIQRLLECRRKDGEETLVGCWVTNHAKVQRFVLGKLFPAWGLRHIGQLVWVKITSGNTDKGIEGGQLVFPLDNKQGRKPYEVLLLGHTRSKPHVPHTGTRLFASVPLDHSRKPIVLDLLRDFLPSTEDINVYEIFARSLFAGPASKGYWISIGNEPFTFNQEGVGYVTPSSAERVEGHPHHNVE